MLFIAATWGLDLRKSSAFRGSRADANVGLSSFGCLARFESVAGGTFSADLFSVDEDGLAASGFPVATVIVTDVHNVTRMVIPATSSSPDTSVELSETSVELSS